MSNRLTVRQFFALYPTDEVCLEHIMNVRFGMKHVCRKCKKEATFHRLKDPKRRAYCCSRCGDNLYPTAGTVFHDTRTPLQAWFYAIYLFVTTRHGVSGKELQRNLGVTYKTAWRMGQQIRTLMSKANGFEMLQGHVESDEAYIGGYLSRKGGRNHLDNKTVVVGIKERGGRLVTEVIKSATKNALREKILKNVKKGSFVSTDELPSYNLLRGDGYNHGKVHHTTFQWTKKDQRYGVTHHTNNVESFWRLFKNSITSTHIHVSKQHMQKYLDEFTFRSNHRDMENTMFDLLLAAI